MKHCPPNFGCATRDMTLEEVETKLQECYEVLGPWNTRPEHTQYDGTWWVVRTRGFPPPPGPGFHRARWVAAEKALKIAKNRLKYLA